MLLRSIRYSTAQVPECYHQQRGRGSAHTVSHQAALSKAPWPLPDWLPETCRSLQGQGPGRPAAPGCFPGCQVLDAPSFFVPQ